MSSLVPVKRPDRNGKLVTRHVRADKAMPQPKQFPVPAAAPAPVEGGPPVSLEEYAEAMNVIHSRLGSSPRKDVNENLAQMSMMTPDAFREVVDEFRTKDEYHAALMAVSLDFPTKDTTKFNHALLVNLSLMQTIADLKPDGRIRSYPPRITQGEQLWHAAQRSRMGYRSPIAVRTLKAVAFAIWATDRTHLRPISIKDEIDNLGYIGENLDEVMAHRNVIRKRGTIDRDFIDSLISTKTPAISEGVL